MSYIVTLDTRHHPGWFNNAFIHVHSGGFEPVRDTMDTWNKTFNNILTLFYPEPETPVAVWRTIFPSEQDYIWFVLKWS